MARILRNNHVLAVPDVEASAGFYAETLGFRPVLEVEGWRFVQRDNCLIMLGECPSATPAGDLGDHSYVAYLVVDDVDAFWQQAQETGAETSSPPTDKPWGMREFGLRTPDGHRFMIGQDLE